MSGTIAINVRYLPTLKRRTKIILTIPLVLAYCWLYIPFAGVVNTLWKMVAYTVSSMRSAWRAW